MSSFLSEAWRLMFWWIVVPAGVMLALLTVAALLFEVLDGVERRSK